MVKLMQDIRTKKDAEKIANEYIQSIDHVCSSDIENKCAVFKGEEEIWKSLPEKTNITLSGNELLLVFNALNIAMKNKKLTKLERDNYTKLDSKLFELIK